MAHIGLEQGCKYYGALEILHGISLDIQEVGVHGGRRGASNPAMVWISVDLPQPGETRFSDRRCEGMLPDISGRVAASLRGLRIQTVPNIAHRENPPAFGP
jgi:hypothetical protein